MDIRCREYFPVFTILSIFAQPKGKKQKQKTKPDNAIRFQSHFRRCHFSSTVTALKNLKKKELSAEQSLLIRLHFWEANE